MPLRHACFISYSHSEPNAEADRIIQAVHTVLASEVSFRIKNVGVYLDARLRPGDFFDQALARALCESACMVMVFWPAYFDDRHTYCSKEYKAMERIEVARLSLLPAGQREHGLIVPLVVRREQDLPPEVRQRQYTNLQRLTLGFRRLEHHPAFRIEMSRIADYVVDRYRELSRVVPDVCGDCSTMSFPPEIEIRAWLQSALAWSPSFVMR